ncbi:MAG: hypothetical protein JWQ19_3892 [Subtercola sp.]|nr:hypothetical protein [Subtercola sp.]
MVVTMHGAVGKATLAAAAIDTHTAYEAIRRRLGYRPEVTLDAATFLAAHHLRYRLDRKQFAQLGDEKPPSIPFVLSFADDEVICVVFSLQSQRHVLVAATDGQVYYMGRIENPSDPA